MSDREQVWIPSALSALTAIMATGCATVFYGTHQKIEVVTNPPGATVTVYPGENEYRSPTALRLRRVGNYTLRITHPGFEPETVILDEVLAQNRAFLAIFFGLGIGGFVDLATGAFAEQVPGQVEVNLLPTSRPTGPNGVQRMSNEQRQIRPRLGALGAD